MLTNRCSGAAMAKHILIVDDNECMRNSLLNLFKKDEDAVCAVAVNGREAVEKAKEFQPDLVVIDFSMPEMNGLEATAKLKAISPRLRIVLLTAFKDTTLDQQAYEAGATWVLSKTEDDVSRVLDFARILMRPDSSETPLQVKN